MSVESAVDYLVSESSGIPIDREQIASVVDKIVKSLYSGFNNAEYLDTLIGDVGLTITHDVIHINDAAGKPIRLSIDVRSEESFEGTLLAGAHFSYKRYGVSEFSFVVVISLNGLLTWRNLFKNENVLKRSLTASISHEVTHASDPFITRDIKSGSLSKKATASQNEIEYFNDPYEVRAYITSIKEELILFKGEYASDGIRDIIRDKFVDFAEWLKTTSNVYDHIEKFWTPENKKYVLSKIYEYIFGKV